MRKNKRILAVLSGLFAIATVLFFFNILHVPTSTVFINVGVGMIVYLVPFAVFYRMTKGLRIAKWKWEHRDHGGPFPVWMWIYLALVIVPLMMFGMIFGSEYELYPGLTFVSHAISIIISSMLSMFVWHTAFASVAKRYYNNGDHVRDIMIKRGMSQDEVWEYLKANGLTVGTMNV